MIKQKEEKNLIVGLDIGTSKIVTIVSEITNSWHRSAYITRSKKRGGGKY